MSKISIKHMGNDHSDWLRSLDFYKQELMILKNRLTEIAGKNTGYEAARNVEHFENQFKVQNEIIDQLNHDIRLNIASTSRELQATGLQFIDKMLLVQHNFLKDKFVEEEKIINGLRHEFNEFASVWM